MADQTGNSRGGDAVAAPGDAVGLVRLEDLLAVGDPFATLVRDYVLVDGIEWYQRAKRWRRCAYRATLAAGALVSLVLVGLSLLAGSRLADQHNLQLPTGAGGVIVAGLTYVMGTTDFRRQWHVFTEAQTEMEYDLAEWELAMADAAAASSAEETHRIRRDATRTLLAKARSIRRREQHAFFGNSRPEPSHELLVPLGDHDPAT